MPQKGTVIGDILGEFGEQGKKVVKEVATEIVKTPINILEGIDPVNTAEVAQKTQQYKAEEKSKLAKVRSGLEAIRTVPPPERVSQGAEMAEQAKTNQAAQQNNQLSASMTQKKKMQPLVLQQKRKDKLHGAG